MVSPCLGLLKLNVDGSCIGDVGSVSAGRVIRNSNGIIFDASELNPKFYIIVLSSYSAYGKYTPQNRWIEEELPKVNRSETPWLIVLMHSPWYNSYTTHYMEGETMRVMYEPLFVKYKVDVVFAGHVHAYERSHRISNVAYNIVNGICIPVKNHSAPVYITIGDGGNIEGLATNMTEPQPACSSFREASFGHATFNIENRTHAYYGWHRNQDGYAVTADPMWFFNRYYHPDDDSTSAQHN
ncbi:PREDICTED: purple acid phosphatase 10-like [Prunus mume]|uniref:acid phosphatase n=1 Tax=Prunus mume TaxID=102107 RepID=A0ABM0PB65_PRUMU|nr:PREDICTED: purple acid phosphatase 10-like [Prunus mume]